MHGLLLGRLRGNVPVPAQAASLREEWILLQISPQAEMTASALAYTLTSQLQAGEV
jgi:hypothetical protein